MRTIIAGSRNITDINVVREAVKKSKFSITEVVSGCAKGVDKLGEEIAKELGLPIKRFPAKWDEYGKRAGFIRNEEMAEYADALIAVWDGKSKGTKHIINLAAKNGLYLFVLKLDDIK